MSDPIPLDLTRFQRQVLDAVGPEPVSPKDVAYRLKPSPLAQDIHHRLSVKRILIRLWKRGLLESETDGATFWRKP